MSDRPVDATGYEPSAAADLSALVANIIMPAEVCERLGLDPDAVLGAACAVAACALFIWLIFFAFDDDDDIQPPDNIGYGW